MKRLLTIVSITLLTLTATAQKIVFIDTEYILGNIPAYESANEQLAKLSKQYEAEIKSGMEEVERLYEEYRTQSVFLTNDMKVKKENEIVEKERYVKGLQQTYFGQNGEFFKQRELLVKPIQDQVFAAIEQLSKEKNYSAVFDKASNIGLMYCEANLDISDQVLSRMGYSK